MFNKNDRVTIGDGYRVRHGVVLAVSWDGEVKIAWDDAPPSERPMYYPPQAIQKEGEE